MKRVTETGRLPWALVLGLVLLLGGCAAPSGGGDGGAGGDGGGADNEVPLPEYQLGEDEQLDADVAAISEADNAALECIAFSPTNEEAVLLALKNGYTSDPDRTQTFPEFVADIVEPEQAKSDEICNTTLENASPELLDLIGRLTEAGNFSVECAGDEPDVTDEDSLLVIKKGYFPQSVNVYSSMVEFAEVLVEEAEQAVAGGCS